MTSEILCEGECGHSAPPQYLFDGLCLVCSSRAGGEA